MKKLQLILLTLSTLVIFAGCATWEGIKKDTNEAYESTKEAINEATE